MMAGERSRLERLGAAAKDLGAALRDGTLFLLFVLLLVIPGVVRDRLEGAGFRKGTLAGFEWEAQMRTASAQTLSVGQSVETATEQYSTLLERLDSLEQRITDPSLRREVQALGEQAKSSRGGLRQAEEVLKRSLVTQQEIIQNVAPADVAESGWVFLGKLAADEQWAKGDPRTVRAVPWPIAPGAVLVVVDDVYLRSDSALGSRAEGRILAVAEVGASLKVLELTRSPARDGGSFIWAKVQRVGLAKGA